MLKDSKKINYQVKKKELLEEIKFLKKYSDIKGVKNNG